MQGKESPQIAGVLPPPPHARLQSSGKLAHALIRLLDGSRVRGTFVEIDADNEKLVLQVSGSDSLQSLALSSVKVVYVDDPRHWHTPYDDDEDRPLEIEPTITSFNVTFSDSDSIRGKTLGFRTDSLGLYLYPLRSHDKVTQCFIPAGAVSHYQIGKMMGEALVEDGLVAQASIDAALNDQRQERTERIGEVLGRHSIVTASELERALESQTAGPTKRLGEILIEDGLITAEQLEESLSLQKEGRKRPLGEVLVSVGVLTETELHGALARKLGIPRVELKRFVIDRAVYDSIPARIIEKHHVVPLYQFDNRLAVAMSDPLDADALRDLRFSANVHIDPVLAESTEISRLISVMKSTNQVDLDDLAPELEEELTIAATSTEVLTHSNNLVVRLVNKILVGAIYNHSSDVHIEPRGRPGQTQIRERIDGRLRETLHFPNRLHRAVIARLKVMAGMDVTETRRPQDGQINLKKFGISENSLRVATIPTRGSGEDAVLRIIGGAKSMNISGLGLSRDNESRLVSMLDNPSGLILATGPTGSGKSTTLHALLTHLNTPERKIWTAEDPIEIRQPGLRQVQVAREIGLTFDTALRAFMRLDPDIIMVGEIRDTDTAKVSISAALTGHLVLSTLHTNGAAETISRLLDMDIDAFDFADSLLAALTQRLTRRLCKHCKQSHTPSHEELLAIAEEYAHDIGQPARQQEFLAYLSQSEDSSPPEIAVAKGCSECRQSGYKGLIALHELITTTPTIKDMIHHEATTEALRAEAVKEGMHTLRQDGLSKVLRGLTTIHEVHGALGTIATV